MKSSSSFCSIARCRAAPVSLVNHWGYSGALTDLLMLGVLEGRLYAAVVEQSRPFLFLICQCWWPILLSSEQDTRAMEDISLFFSCFEVCGLKGVRRRRGPVAVWTGISFLQPTNGCRRKDGGLELLSVYVNAQEQAIERAHHRWWDPGCQCGWISLYWDTWGRAVIIQLGSSFSIFAVFNPLTPEAPCQACGFLFLVVIWLPKVRCPLPACPEAGIKVILGYRASHIYWGGQ